MLEARTFEKGFRGAWFRCKVYIQFPPLIRSYGICLKCDLLICVFYMQTDHDACGIDDTF